MAAARFPGFLRMHAEYNPGVARLPASAQGALSHLRVLSCDCSVLFSNTPMFAAAAGQLEHLYVSGSGLMWHSLAAAAPAEDVLESLAAMRALKKVTFVVQSQVGSAKREHGPVLHCHPAACWLHPSVALWFGAVGARVTVHGRHIQPLLPCPGRALPPIRRRRRCHRWRWRS